MNICRECGGPIYKSPSKWWHNERYQQLRDRCLDMDVPVIHEAVEMFRQEFDGAGISD